MISWFRINSKFYVCTVRVRSSISLTGVGSMDNGCWKRRGCYWLTLHGYVQVSGNVLEQLTVLRTNTETETCEIGNTILKTQITWNICHNNNEIKLFVNTIFYQNLPTETGMGDRLKTWNGASDMKNQLIKYWSA